MSQTQEVLVDPELKEMVVNALEESGQLASIRAQLRASVYLSLEGQKDFPLKKPNLGPILNNREGQLALYFVRNFLEKASMLRTLSVFDAETRGESLQVHADAADGLDLDERYDEPVMMQFMQKHSIIPLRSNLERPKTAPRREVVRNSPDDDSIPDDEDF